MEITEGTSFEQIDGTWQRFEVTFTESDLAISLAEVGFTEQQVKAMPLLLKYQWMSAMCRKFLLVQTVQFRQSDKSWRENVLPGLGRALQTDLESLAARIRAGG